MALELYAGETHQSIDHSEEFLLQLASENPEKYPELSKLWTSFFDDPMLTNEQSGRLVHELIELCELNGKANKRLVHSVTKLLTFFSNAFKKSLNVRCRSD